MDFCKIQDKINFVFILSRLNKSAKRKFHNQSLEQNKSDDNNLVGDLAEKDKSLQSGQSMSKCERLNRLNVKNLTKKRKRHGKNLFERKKEILKSRYNKPTLLQKVKSFLNNR